MSLHDHERIHQRLTSVADPISFLVNLFAHAPVGFAVWTADGQPLLTNKAFMDLFRSEPPPGYNVLTDELLAANGMLPLFQRAFRGETVHVPTFWYDPREHTALNITDGRRVAISMTIFPLFKSDGALDYVAATYKDDTELTLANELLRVGEQRQRESEARRAAVMEAALDAIVVMDDHGVITDFNPAAERTFGFTRAQALGQSLADLMIPPALRGAHVEGLRRYRETRHGPLVGQRVEVPALRSDGTEFPAEVAIVQIATDGPPVFTGHIRDITERRRAADAEMLRRAKEAAEEANAELEAFSYSVAHDLRTPLRAINGFSAALREDCGDILPADAHDMLARIVANTERMANLIDSLLGLARLTRTEVRRERVDLGELVATVIAQLRAAEPSRTVELAISSTLVASGDPQLLRALVENLVGNAWKFTSGREAARIEVGRDETSFYVRDNGAGFDMGHAASLFVPFRRLHTTREFEGSGIGLATVARIVRRHGGRVWAEGAVDRGATFRFTLSPTRSVGTVST